METLDTSGLKWPLPVLKAKKALKTLAVHDQPPHISEHSRRLRRRAFMTLSSYVDNPALRRPSTSASKSALRL